MHFSITAAFVASALSFTAFAQDIPAVAVNALAQAQAQAQNAQAQAQNLAGFNLIPERFGQEQDRFSAELPPFLQPGQAATASAEVTSAPSNIRPPFRPPFRPFPRPTSTVTPTSTVQPSTVTVTTTVRPTFTPGSNNNNQNQNSNVNTNTNTNINNNVNSNVNSNLNRNANQDLNSLLNRIPVSDIWGASFNRIDPSVVNGQSARADEVSGTVEGEAQASETNA